MIEVSIKTNFKLALEKALLFSAGPKLIREAAAVALTRTAASAAFALRKEMPDIFDRPTSFTAKSLLYRKADAASLRASVFIRDEAAKGTPPSKYLAPEILGGPRGDKRSERSLKAAGIMQAGQSLVPGRGMALDRYGNIPGPMMVLILSMLRAFNEVGFNANASTAARQKVAKGLHAMQLNNRSFFVGRTKAGGEPLAVYRLVSPGKVEPVLAFVSKRPEYAEQFPFFAEVAHFAAAAWPREMQRALYERIKGYAGGK